jgi:hypothetical protein
MVPNFASARAKAEETTAWSSAIPDFHVVCGGGRVGMTLNVQTDSYMPVSRCSGKPLKWARWTKVYRGKRDLFCLGSLQGLPGGEALLGLEG